jgi:hypothetical protein
MTITTRSWLLPASAVVFAFLLAVEATTSPKRGLVYTPNSQWPEDNKIWTTQPSDLTWYYNYQNSPTDQFTSLGQDKFEFVPMLWGAPSSSSDTGFLNSIKSLINDKKMKISHVLTFNEPDQPTKYGGSQVDPAFGDKVWVNNMIPLQKLGVKVGLPACSGGSGGVEWTKQFLSECSKLISTGGQTKNCTFDFVPLHWYGNFEGLASHIGEWYAT